MSYTFALRALRHVEEYGERAKVLYLRQSHSGCRDFESLCLDLYGRIYGRALRFNGHEGLFRFPSGGSLEVNQLADQTDYQKYQGRSFSLLMIDEAGQFATPDLLDRLRSNLRGPKDMPLRCVVAANPAEIGHVWLSQRYVFKAAPWHPFPEDKSKREWIYAPSTFLDNPHIDQLAYRTQLESSCPSDPELLRAWLEGDWSVARGAYFAAVIDEKRNAIDPWQSMPTARSARGEWEYYLTHDFGVSAPSVTYVVAKSPGAEFQGKHYPRDSLVLIDELATNEPGNLAKGMGYTVPVLAELIREMSTRWKMKRAAGVADDSIFANTGHNTGSIANEFTRAKVFFRPAKKADRVSGWNIMRRLLQDAGKPDVPGLYISRAAEYFWATVPYLARDPRRIEDVDSRGPDHAADAVRYGCLNRGRSVTVTDFQTVFRKTKVTNSIAEFYGIR